MFALRQRILGPAASLAKRSLRSNRLVTEPRFSSTYQYASPEAIVLAPNNNTASVSLSSIVAANVNSLSVSTIAVTVASNWWNALQETGILMISTLKRRRKMMNKHKLRKRRKKNRMKNKK